MHINILCTHMYNGRSFASHLIAHHYLLFSETSEVPRGYSYFILAFQYCPSIPVVVNPYITCTHVKIHIHLN